MLLALTFLFFENKQAKGEQAFASVTIRFGALSVKYQDRFIAPTDYTVADEFFERRINAPLCEKIECVENSLSGGSNPKASMLYTFPFLEESVNEIIAKINRPPVDATISFKPYNRPMFTVTKERVGYAVCEQKVYYDVYRALKMCDNAVVEIKPEVLLPSVKSDDLKAQTSLRAGFSTDYSSSGENRKHNIALALSKINGKVIGAGEEFSFNKAVGVRSKENGFADAKIIVGGEYTDGVGGGVCQASTTLYNCVLLSGLTVTEVRNHTLAPSYVPPSFDAMVSSGYSDLRFVNDSGAPVYIYAVGDGKTATVRLYGVKNPYKIVRESKTVSTTAIPEDKVIVDETGEYGTLFSEEEKVRVKWGIKGISSEGYLCYYEKGKLVKRELIRKDVYLPVQGIVAVKPKTIQNSW